MHDLALSERLALALDVSHPDAALDLYLRTRDVVGVFKVGWELYLQTGPRLIERMRRDGSKVFLDFKLHDIPNTVKGAVQSAARLGVSYLTVHTLGGEKMLKAAAEALTTQTTIPGAEPIRLLGVTVLTSHTGQDLEDLGFTEDPETLVSRLAQSATGSGLTGIVCSPEEARTVRAACGDDALIVCPGIRPEGAALGDQARTQTPAQAIAAGADVLVVGRPIRTAPDPRQAAGDILAEIEAALAGRAAG